MNDGELSVIREFNSAFRQILPTDPDLNFSKFTSSKTQFDEYLSSGKEQDEILHFQMLLHKQFLLIYKMSLLHFFPREGVHIHS